MLSPIFDTSTNDNSWHSALEAIFTYILNPRGEDSVIFKFSKATPLCYLIDGVQPQSLDSLKLFMGVSQFLEEALRNLQVQTYYAEYPREKPECRDDGHDDTPHGIRDIPQLKPDDLLWKSTKACIDLEELKRRFSYMASGPNELNPGSKMYDVSWIVSSSKGTKADTETCKGPLRLGFAIHRTLLDTRLLAIQREHVIRNLLHCIQFNLWLFRIVSHTETATRLTTWMDKCTRSTWGPNKRLVEYIETFVCAPKFLYRDRQLSSQMARNFLRRIGSPVHPFPEVSESDESLDEAIGEQNMEHIEVTKDAVKSNMIVHKKTFIAYLNARKYSSYRSVCPGFECVDELGHLSDVSETSSSMTKPSKLGLHKGAHKGEQAQATPVSLVASVSQAEPKREKQYIATKELDAPCLAESTQSMESLHRAHSFERQRSLLMAAHITRERGIYTLRRLLHTFGTKALPQDASYPEAYGSAQKQEVVGRCHIQQNIGSGFREAGTYTQESYYIPFDPLRDQKKATWGWRARNMIKKKSPAAFCSEHTRSMVERWLQGIPFFRQLEEILNVTEAQQSGALQHEKGYITREASPVTLKLLKLGIPSATSTGYWGLRLKGDSITKTHKQSSIIHAHTCPPSPETPESSKIWVPPSPFTPSDDWTPPQLYTPKAPSGTPPKILDPPITCPPTKSHISMQETDVYGKISECRNQPHSAHTLLPSASSSSGSSSTNDADFGNNSRGESLVQGERQDLQRVFKRNKAESLLDQQEYEESRSSITGPHTSLSKKPVKSNPLLASKPGSSALFQAVAEQNLALSQAYAQVEASAARLRLAQLDAERLLNQVLDENML